MNTIVVATDFSKASIRALKYAIDFANNISADVQIVWVDKIASTRPLYYSPANDYNIKIKKKLEEIVDRYGKRVFNGKIEYKIRKGRVYEEVVNQAKYFDAKLIVAGTHGSSGFEEMWIGNNAYKIVSAATCPVITVRHDFWVKHEINKILLPIDSTIDTRQKVPITADVAKLFRSEIIVLSIYHSKSKEIEAIVNRYTEQTVKYLTKKNIKHSVHSIETTNHMIANSVIDFAKKNSVDLISIMTEQETAVANMLLGSNAHQLINHSPIPVMSINPKDMFEVDPFS